MKKRTKKLIIVISILLIAFGGTLYYLNLHPDKSTSKYAIIQYCKASNCSYNFISVKDTKVVDEQYGRKFIVTGLSGEMSDVNFFYLNKTDEGWVVISAGTGP